MRVVGVVSLLVALCLGPFGPGADAAAHSLYLEDLTWTELRDALAAGTTTTIIIPVGGTEQSGPQIALGKHNIRAHVLAGRIAQALGDTLVAPVVAYVPEGNISPPTEHMRFPGTISIPESAFKATLVAAAQSFRQAGFRHVVLLGDHGGYQAALKSVAAELNRDWAKSTTRAHFIAEYYAATRTAYVQALRAKGLSEAEIGTHAGTADTSLMLAIDPAAVRTDRLGEAHGALGVQGDARPSTAALGQLGVEPIIQESVAAIRKARQDQR
ncbi:MAG TPA: creatininase family protein [Reyranella sp.]|nr:creatininase family protein [Reyranella sp.]